MARKSERSSLRELFMAPYVVTPTGRMIFTTRLFPRGEDLSIIVENLGNRSAFPSGGRKQPWCTCRYRRLPGCVTLTVAAGPLYEHHWQRWRCIPAVSGSPLRNLCRCGKRADDVILYPPRFGAGWPASAVPMVRSLSLETSFHFRVSHDRLPAMIGNLLSPMKWRVRRRRWRKRRYMTPDSAALCHVTVCRRGQVSPP